MPTSTPCFHFNSAIVRTPAASVVNGLRAENRGNPDYAGVKAEHDAYQAALKSVGMEVTVLPELTSFPDSIFVEDPALVFTEGAILLRPGATSRQGEAAEIEPTLHELFDKVLELPHPGFADGGDVLVTPKSVMIGLSSRTDLAGATALIECLKTLGYNSEIVDTPEGVLHFKTGCSLLDEETVLVTRRMEQSDIFNGFNKVVLPDGEEPAANAVRINESVLISSNYKRTIDLLDQKGYRVVPVKAEEIEKIDAGLSCMSLRWFRR
ncbi:MAG: dimethylarginine dimethylaminohydrolase family protein [Desulforhopalus sp.]